MVFPFLQMRLRGFIWYQGETEAFVGPSCFDWYLCSFPEMIKDWRTQWNLTAQEAPFVYVQLAPYNFTGGYDSAFGIYRAIQSIGFSVPYTYMASAVDLGDLYSPETSIHPRLKQPLGTRLSLGLQLLVYGINVEDLGPIAASASVITQPPNAVVSVTFSPSTVGLGLLFRDAYCPSPLISGTWCTWFNIVTSDSKFYNATAFITGTNTIILGAVTLPGVTISQVQYAIGDWPVATLYNSNDLPAYPFVLIPS